MNRKEIEEFIKSCKYILDFSYNNIYSNVDPYYKDGEYSYLLFYDSHEQMVYSIDDVMNTPFINGKTLAEVTDELIIG